MKGFIVAVVAAVAAAAPAQADDIRVRVKESEPAKRAGLFSRMFGNRTTPPAAVAVPVMVGPIDPARILTSPVLLVPGDTPEAAKKGPGYRIVIEKQK